MSPRSANCMSSSRHRTVSSSCSPRETWAPPRRYSIGSAATSTGQRARGLQNTAAGTARAPQAPADSLLKPNYLFEAAEYVGRISLAVQREHGPALNQAGVSAETTFILGGQIAGQPHGLMLIYPQGNYFAASPETPYLQIGENKYGKPAVDRIARPELSLVDGARLCLVSLDATSAPTRR